MTMYVKECATTSATAYLILYATSDLTSSDDGRTHAGGGGDPSVPRRVERREDVVQTNDSRRDVTRE